MDKCVEKSKVFAQMILYGFRAPNMTVTEFVDNLPVVDVQEVRHARWEEHKTVPWTRCSYCGKGEWKGYIPSVKEATKWMLMCPNCGARMDLEEKS